ncbi:HAD family hydrolase [Nonomuraea roseoviolacea]|uniref:HAD superfamily hydrolase (TIGR01509 family) n=1 Tax=Nonomuraea roseoviolacea subsp. carminata TaxID=160689 RepID=A0ABT1JSG1_9ACTN|nr:HAD family phosphatase [Nonomuraea roseoviolacea]MCP2344671.1 HAD superfamily hydrolase (TIGR01509 family) [Nonomuraea roseoviolacea subsp. carminata]
MSPRRAAAGEIARRRVWLCDLDGTLVDSAPAHRAAFRAALAEVAPGLAGSFRYDAHAGASTADVAAALGAGPEVAARLVRRKQQIYRGHVEAGRVEVLPGARRLLDRLVSGGRTAYLVTSGSRGSVERVLSATALGGYFRGVLTADDVPTSKPHPGCYLEARRRWAIEPGDAVAVEDSAHGVAAAVRAGLVTLQVHAAEPAPGAIAMNGLDDVVSLLDAEASLLDAEVPLLDAEASLLDAEGGCP